MQEFNATIKIRLLAEDRTNARFLLMTTLMKHLPFGTAPDIDDIIIEEET